PATTLLPYTTLVRSMQGTGTDQYCDALPAIEHIGRGKQALLIWDVGMHGIANTAVYCSMFMRWRFHRRQILYVVRQDNAGYSPPDRKSTRLNSSPVK